MNDPRSKKEGFSYPTGQYYGDFTSDNLRLDTNLQQFAQQIGYFCNLENNGRVSPEDAYHQIKELWQQLKQSKK
jgi:hypothetical protein